MACSKLEARGHLLHKTGLWQWYTGISVVRTKDLYQVQETLKFFFLTYIQLCVPTPIFRMSKVLLDGSTQLAKGYHFAQKFSKYFFHFTLGQKISKVIVLSWFTFFKGKEVFLNFQFFLSMYSKTQKTKKCVYTSRIFLVFCVFEYILRKI